MKDQKDRIEIIVATDFSDSVGARERSDGEFSGQEFFEDYLRDNVKKAIAEKKKVWIDFDGTWGYPSSFISSAFGKLSDKFGKDVLKYIEIKSE
ncbi:MAG: STAS-like domain-containing protein [Salinispira sp.]